MGRDMAKAYHYAKGAGKVMVYRHGLFPRDDFMDCRGASIWMTPTPGAAKTVAEDWRGVLVLTRFVIEPDMPTNTASFLLGASIRMIRKDARFHTLLTYADEGQGHTGAIYRATNWTYLGLTNGSDVWVDSEGKMIARKAGPHTRSVAEMEALSYVNMGKTRKHKFVMRLT